MMTLSELYEVGRAIFLAGTHHRLQAELDPIGAQEFNFFFLKLANLPVRHVEPHADGHMDEQEEEHEAEERKEIQVLRVLAVPEGAHERVPHAQHTHEEDAHDGVLVERGQVGDVRQRAVDYPLERDAREQQRECGLQAALRHLAVHREDGQRRHGDEEDEKVGVEEVVAGPTRRVHGGHDLGRLGYGLAGEHLGKLVAEVVALLIRLLVVLAVGAAHLVAGGAAYCHKFEELP